MRLTPGKIAYNQVACRFRQRVFDNMVTLCLGNSIPLSPENLLKVYTSIISAGGELVEPNVSLTSQFRARPKEFALACWYEVDFLAFLRSDLD